MLGQEVEEVPLRHQRDEFAVRRQMAEIDHPKVLGADLAGQCFDLLMRQLQEFVEEAELDHQFERRRMNRVAAKVAEEIGVLLEHRHVDAGAGQQESQHHSRRAAAGDAALRRDRRVWHLYLAPAGIVRQQSRSANAKARVDVPSMLGGRLITTSRSPGDPGGDDEFPSTSS